MKPLFQSFANAFNGLYIAFISQRNVQVHVAALFFISLTGYFLCFSKAEWIAVILISVMVISAELFNTALEKLCDRLHPEIHPEIKAVKDIAAAAVLLLAIGAVVIFGIIIFSRELF